MSYVVLARKYRPRKFEDMVGQDAAVTALGNALKQQRLHHAYLFTGTRGIGKTTVSRIFAKCLNCLGVDGAGGITATPCGVCDACTQIDQDRFMDYIELDAASNRSIAEVRELLERAAYKPSVGRFKVFMIDEAHQLTKDSFNALLKTLEEPPDYVKFVLATTDPQKMPATVLSRCLQFNLRPMAPQTVREYLAVVLKAEGITFDDAALQALGRAAQGSMRDALSLTDQAIAFGGGQVLADRVRAMLGSVGREPAVGLVRALCQRDGRAVVMQVDALRAQGLSPDGTLEAMATLLQDMAIEQAAPGAQVDLVLDVDDVQRLAAEMPSDDLQLLYSIVLQGRRELPLAPDGHAGLTMVLLRLMAFPAEASEGGGPKSVVNVVNVGMAPAPPPPPTAALRAAPAVAMTRAWVKPGLDDGAAAPVGATMPVPAGTLMPIAMHEAANDPLSLQWFELVRRLNEQQLIQALVRELAMQSALVACDAQVDPALWRLVVERESLMSTTHVDKLSAALSQCLGSPQKVIVQAGQAHATPAQREAAERAERAAAAERVVRADPLVQSILNQFPTARIVPGSIKTTQEFKAP